MFQTRFHMQDDRNAAKWLGLSLRKFRELIESGAGPRHITLPSGERRFLVEELQAWATEGARELHVECGGAKVIPFPGSNLVVKRRRPTWKGASKHKGRPGVRRHWPAHSHGREDAR